MNVMRKELMGFDQELYALTNAVKRNSFNDLDTKGSLLYKGSDSFKLLNQSVIELQIMISLWHFSND